MNDNQSQKNEFEKFTAAFNIEPPARKYTEELSAFTRSDGTKQQIELHVRSLDSEAGPNFSLIADFPGIATTMAEQSKRRFMKDGRLYEAFCFFTAKREIIFATPVLHQNDIAVWLKSIIPERQIIGVIHTREIWLYVPKGPTDHTMKQIKDGEMEVKDLNEQDRGEALQVLAQTSSGYIRLWMTQIIRNGDQVSLGTTMIVHDAQEIKIRCGPGISGLFDPIQS